MNQIKKQDEKANIYMIKLNDIRILKQLHSFAINENFSNIKYSDVYYYIMNNKVLYKQKIIEDFIIRLI